MSLQIGIVGLPNVGKTTIFNTLTGAKATVASYPFTTIKPNVGVVAAADERLERIAAIVKPERIVPATIELLDIAGLVKGASYGEGLGNQFLGYIRNVDAIAMVVRCFIAPEIPHVTPHLDPREDIGVINLELALADLATVERRLERVKRAIKGQKGSQYQPELEILTQLQLALNEGLAVRNLPFEQEERELLKGLNLLTAKPILYVANVGEEDLPDGGNLALAVAEVAKAEGWRFVMLCAEMETELAEWAREEAAAFRREEGLGEAGVTQFVKASYSLLSLLTFFTTTGGKEVRAWRLPRGSNVLAAAGHIHSDMERGFIRAEVVTYSDLMAAGSFAEVRERGLARLEGRDYMVQDGDIIHIRFAI